MPRKIIPGHPRASQDILRDSGASIKDCGNNYGIGDADVPPFGQAKRLEEAEVERRAVIRITITDQSGADEKR